MNNGEKVIAESKIDYEQEVKDEKELVSRD